MTCLNGCFDLDYGENEDTPKECTCTPEDTLAAVLRFNALGILVVEGGVR